MSVKDPNPLNRPDVWSLSASSTVVDAKTYYEPSDAGETVKQIVNTAGDPLSGIKRRQGEITMSVRGNRAQSPFSLAAGLINRVNANAWANGAAKTWLCTGVSAQQQSELVGTEIVEFWSVAFSFAYRPETWAAQAANVGLNELVVNAGGQTVKRRITVEDNNGNDVPTSKPLPLNTDGTYKGANAAADIITFNVFLTADFAAQFGNPPT